MRIFSQKTFIEVHVFYLLLKNVLKMATFFGEILESVKSFDYGDLLPSSEIFCTKVGNKKEDCLIVCIKHLRIILILKRKFKCTTEDGINTLVIPIFDERYCRGYLKSR